MDQFVPAYHGMQIKNNIPLAKISLMEKACHNLLVEQPQLTFQLIEKFLEQI
jgi:pimeloyl-ACP methyl ester carboxylesterase